MSGFGESCVSFRSTFCVCIALEAEIIKCSCNDKCDQTNSTEGLEYLLFISKTHCSVQYLDASHMIDFIFKKIINCYC